MAKKAHHQFDPVMNTGEEKLCVYGGGMGGGVLVMNKMESCCSSFGENYTAASVGVLFLSLIYELLRPLRHAFLIICHCLIKLFWITF